MSVLYGNWAVTWSDSDHSGVNRQHLLRVPLQRIRPAVSVNKHTAVSLDYSTQNTVVFGSAYEIAAKIKAEDNTQSLADLLEAGMKGTTLTLVDLSQTDRTVDVYLIDPADAWLATYDMQGTPWEFEAELRFRRTSGTAFPDWLLYQAYGPTGLLFKYTPGMDLSGATFTRAAAANYINVNGVTTAAATNVARDAHHCTVSSTWTRVLRCEASTSELLSFPWNHAPQDMTVYCKWVERTTLANGPRYWGMGGDASTSGSAWMLYMVDANSIGLAHNNTANGWNTGADVSTQHSPGDLVEFCAQFDVSNTTMRAFAAENGGAVQTGTTAALTNIGSTWDTDVLTLHGWGDTGADDLVSADFLEFKVAAGVQTMAHMRSL